MGNTSSTPVSIQRDTELIKGLATIDETSYPNFFEGKSIVPHPTAPKKRKYSSTSTASSNSTTPPMIKDEEEQDDTIEILCNRKYLKDTANHRFYLPVDDKEADRQVILVKNQTNMMTLLLNLICSTF